MKTLHTQTTEKRPRQLKEFKTVSKTEGHTLRKMRDIVEAATQGNQLAIGAVRQPLFFGENVVVKDPKSLDLVDLQENAMRVDQRKEELEQNINEVNTALENERVERIQSKKKGEQVQGGTDTAE